MRERKARRHLSVLLCCAAGLLPGALPAQAPPQPGKLVVKSVPPGAAIAIDGRSMPQRTNSTFAVPAGYYKVAVSGGPGSLNCAAHAFRVNSGAQTQVQCSAAGWTAQ